MRNRYVFLADMLAIILAAFGAYAFRFSWRFLPDGSFLPFLIASLVVKLTTFHAFGLYARFWRYASFWDLMAVATANSAASILLGIVMVAAVVFEGIPGMSRSLLPIDWLLTLVLTAGARASVRVLAETMALRPPTPSSVTRRVLVIGAGEAGAMVVREMARNPQMGMKPVGFLDDDGVKQGKKLYGVPVLGTIDSIESVVGRRPIDEVVVAIPTAGGAVVRAIADRCRALGVPSRIMPGIYELLDGRLSVSRLRSVDIADLLRRPQVLSQADVARYLTGSTVIVTGAGGSIGSELCRQVAHSRPGQLVLLGHGENSLFQISQELRTRFPSVSVSTVVADVRDRDRIHRVFRMVRPDIIFHAAAHKHVTLMEENIPEAITNNVAGTRNVVDAALACGVLRFVMVSTDKAVSPSSVMGASKRMAEMIVREAAARRERAYVVVRFGNVLGSRGSVVPIFQEQIEKGGPVTVTHPDVRRYFMTIPEAVHLILQAGGLGKGGELFVLDMGEPVYLRQLAEDMIRLSGLTPEEIPIVYTGLRPGEKMDEVLWEAGAVVDRSTHTDIRVVKEPEDCSFDRLGESVDRLEEAANRDDRPRVVRLLGECIPTATLTLPPDTRDPRMVSFGSGA